MICLHKHFLGLFLFHRLVSVPQVRTALRGVDLRLRGLSSRGRLGNAVSGFILPDTAIKSVCRQAHSPHKVPACDALGLPFPIELTKPRPVDFDRLPSRVLSLRLSDFDALTLSLFELFTLQL